MSLNLPELIRLRTSVWVQFKQKASFLNRIAARVQRETDIQRHLYRGRPNLIDEKQIAFVSPVHSSRTYLYNNSKHPTQ